MTTKHSLVEIGILQSCYPDKFGVPRQPGLAPSAHAKLKIRKEFQPEIALEGLSQFSHVWLIFVFHENSNARYHAKVHPPRLQGGSIGLFATRSPHRPNPIGLSLVELEKIEGDTLFLRGADLIDGTPILDVKPYLPEVEAVAEARSGWTSEAKTTEIEVHFSPEQLKFIEEWSLALGEPRLKSLIEETLRLDPRPLVYRGFEGQDQAPYRTQHAVRFYNGDVHFQFVNPNKIEVLSVLVN
jgi:tRNA-Thr(GGU) m(6)t(6)A37 methyltransferase TsaA